jgi:tetratricopeptide (TPR) repeat protein
MRVVRWGVAVGGSFVVLAVVRVVCSGVVDLGDAASWGVASAASAAALTVLGWWASRDEAPSPGGGAALAATARGRGSQAVVGNVGVVIGARARLRDSPITVTVAAPAGPGLRGPVVVGDVPGQAAAFQAREGVLERLLAGGSEPGRSVVLAVTGMRGVGKTQVAAACARRCIDEKWRLVAWVGADTAATVMDGLAQVAAAVGVAQGATQQDTAMALRHWLEAHGERCLVVFDNAGDPGALRRYLPAAGEARVIVTSTSQTVAGLGTHIGVGVFSDAEALAYLRERTGLGDGGARELAAELGNLPLALAQAAAVVKAEHHRDYATYLARLRAFPVAGYLTRTSGDPYPHGAAAAILLALRAVLRSDPCGLAGPLMNVIAWLAPAGVARDVLHTGHSVGVFNPGTDLASLSVELPADVAAAEIDAVLGRLADASLLTFSLDGTSVASHRLTLRVLRDQARHDGTVDASLDAAAALLAAAALELIPAWQHQRAARDLIQHVYVLHAHLRSLQRVPFGVTRRMLGLRSWVLRSLHELADDPAQALAIGQALAADSQRLLGPDHPDTLAVLNNLAQAYTSAGRPAEAIEILERTSAARERVLGAGHPDILVARNNLAGAYRDAGRLPEAIALFERTLADSERLLGTDHPGTLMARNYLASAYRQAGRIAEAVALFERTLAGRVRVLGNDHPDTLFARSNLASVYQDAGRTAEAVALLERTLGDAERVLGADHPSTLTLRSNLASAYQGAGRVAEAVSLFERILADRERVLGDDHPDLVISRGNLGLAYQEVGRVGEAAALYRRALGDAERIHGGDHRHTRMLREALDRVSGEGG